MDCSTNLLPKVKRCRKHKYNARNKKERVISDEINRINNVKLKEAKEHEENGDAFPHCDLRIWLRDCQHEVPEPIIGKTIGNIPEWINGNLLRNGPGQQSFGDSKFGHLFDCSAVLHRFKIKDGKATYQSKLLKSSTYLKNLRANRITVSEFGTRATPDPCRTIFEKFTALFKPEEETDNCMISIYPFKDELYTFTESPMIYKISENLDTERMVNISKYVNIVHHTAHPHVTDDGTVYNVGLSVTPKGPRYAVFVFPNTKKDSPKGIDVFENANIVATVDVRWSFYPGYMHTYGITNNYFILVEQPMTVSLPSKIKSQFNNDPLYKWLKWYDDQPTLIHVVSRKNKKVLKTFEAETFFYLHIINQYEDDDHVIVDICAYKDPKMIECMFFEAIKNAKQDPNYAALFRGRPVRFVLPINGDEVTLKETKAKAFLANNKRNYVIPEILSKMGCETPRINYDMFCGKKYRYFYAISSDVDLENPGMLIKVDTLTKTEITWFEKDTFPCEPIFVPSPNQKEEDDGVILSSLLWSSDPNKVALLVLDAKNFNELGRTVFNAPGPVPKCLHGWFANSV